MLLRKQPLKREPDLLRVFLLEAARLSLLVEKRDGDEPPQRRVDAAEVPEVRFGARLRAASGEATARRAALLRTVIFRAAVRFDEFGDLPVGRLVCGERVQARDCF